MPVIRTSINYRNYTLSEPAPGDTIGVITRDGNYQHCRWNGFIERSAALAMPDAKPVKLFANAFKMDDGVIGHWVEIINSHALLGCWQAGNVWAVLYDDGLCIIPRTTPDPYLSPPHATLLGADQ